jgi:hypothetical protein
MPFRVEAPPPVPQLARIVSPAPELRVKSQFSQTLANLGKRVDAGESWMRRAMSPASGAFGAAELIALQAGIYRYTEAVELLGKLVDRATSGLKTVLQPH